MKRIKLSRYILMVIIIALLNNAVYSQCTIISDGTYGNSQTSELLTYGLYEYGWSSSIYTPTEVGGPQTILTISHYVDHYQSGYSQTGPYTYSNLKVYLAHYNAESWPNTTKISSGYTGISDWTEVYNASMTYNVVNNWQTITLSTTFNYNGTDYLVVHIQDDNADWSYGYPSFHYTNESPTTIKSFKYGWTDYSSPSSGTKTYKVPDVKFCGVGVLPIELIDFYVVNRNNCNNLSWVTASEKNNDYYVIENSIDGYNWYRVGTIKGAGNSNTGIVYDFDDMNYVDTINYYKLTQVDFDYKRKTFDIISVDNRVKPKKIIGEFDYMGQPIKTNHKGLKIILYSDRTSEKVYIN